MDTLQRSRNDHHFQFLENLKVLAMLMTVQAKTKLATVLDSSQVKKLVPQIEDKVLFSELVLCAVEDMLMEPLHRDHGCRND